MNGWSPSLFGVLVALVAGAAGVWILLVSFEEFASRRKEARRLRRASPPHPSDEPLRGAGP